MPKLPINLKNVSKIYGLNFGIVAVTLGGGGVTCICRGVGKCHYVEYFFALLPDFGVLFWGAPRFLGTFSGYSWIFGYHFFW